MIVKRRWIKNRKPFAERMTCQHWWALRYAPDRLISFVSMPCYVVCEKCGHRGCLFTKDLDPFQVQSVEISLKAQNLHNLANREEEKE